MAHSMSFVPLQVIIMSRGLDVMNSGVNEKLDESNFFMGELTRFTNSWYHTSTNILPLGHHTIYDQRHNCSSMERQWGRSLVLMQTTWAVRSLNISVVNSLHLRLVPLLSYIYSFVVAICQCIPRKTVILFLAIPRVFSRRDLLWYYGEGRDLHCNVVIVPLIDRFAETSSKSPTCCIQMWFKLSLVDRQTRCHKVIMMLAIIIQDRSARATSMICRGHGHRSTG